MVHGGTPLGDDSLYECLVFSFEQLFDLERPPYSFLRKLSKGSLSLKPCIRSHEDPDLIELVKALFSTIHGTEEGRGSTALGQVLELFGNIEKKANIRCIRTCCPIAI